MTDWASLLWQMRTKSKFGKSCNLAATTLSVTNLELEELKAFFPSSSQRPALFFCFSGPALAHTWKQHSTHWLDQEAHVRLILNNKKSLSRCDCWIASSPPIVFTPLFFKSLSESLSKLYVGWIQRISSDLSGSICITLKLKWHNHGLRWVFSILTKLFSAQNIWPTRRASSPSVCTLWWCHYFSL